MILSQRRKTPTRVLAAVGKCAPQLALQRAFSRQIVYEPDGASLLKGCPS